MMDDLPEIEGSPLDFSCTVSQRIRMATSEPLASAVPTDPYADYATLLSASFTPSTHANALVLSTNDPSDKITDLTSPAQRIQYDLQEVNRRIDLLVDSP
jgi:Golgi transport complex subunit 5